MGFGLGRFGGKTAFLTKREEDEDDDEWFVVAVVVVDDFDEGGVGVFTIAVDAFDWIASVECPSSCPVLIC
mgnify:CR=1 FL=1